MSRHPFLTDRRTSGALLRAAKDYAVPKQNGRSGSLHGNASAVLSQEMGRFVLMGEWLRKLDEEGNEIDDTCYRANARIVYSSEDQYFQRDNEQDPIYTIYNNDVNLGKPSSTTGDQVWATLRGRWELLNFEADAAVLAKEQFPAVVFERWVEEIDPENPDDKKNNVKQTWIVCPGGRTESGPTNLVHAFHVEKRKWSTSEFGTLPVSMANFGACIVPNEILVTDSQGKETTKTLHMLVCGSGITPESIKFLAQVYTFETGEWYTGEQPTSLAGCPVIRSGNKAIGIGGKSAYYVSSPLQIGGSNGGYGHTITPLWNIDPMNVTTNYGAARPQRVISYSAVATNSIAENEKKFLKNNFSGITLQTSDGVIFLAVGGLEQGAEHPKAVVTYRGSDGRIGTREYEGDVSKVHDYPDSEVVLGECATVAVEKLGQGGSLTTWPAVLCLGGRERKADGIIPHTKVHWLDWDVEKWRDDLFDEAPTKRYHAPAVAIPWLDREKDEDGNDIKDGKIFETIKVFFIGGRGVEMTDFDEDGNPVWENKEHLLGSMDVLDIRTMKWERNWPGFDNTTRKTIKKES